MSNQNGDDSKQTKKTQFDSFTPVHLRCLSGAARLKPSPWLGALATALVTLGMGQVSVSRRTGMNCFAVLAHRASRIVLSGARSLHLLPILESAEAGCEDDGDCPTQFRFPGGRYEGKDIKAMPTENDERYAACAAGAKPSTVEAVEGFAGEREGRPPVHPRLG